MLSLIGILYPSIDHSMVNHNIAQLLQGNLIGMIIDLLCFKRAQK